MKTPEPFSPKKRKLLRFLYETAPGRRLLKLLVRPGFSRLAGGFLDSPLSRPMIGPFIRNNQIDMADYFPENYRSFNDFFTRTFLPDRRPIDRDKNHLIAPCDGNLTVIPIGADSLFTVKGVPYTLSELLKNQGLADRYLGGYLFLFRLTPMDYHRYCYACDGAVSEKTRIPGVLHTVDPVGAAQFPVYRENAREFCLLETEEFGRILTMEVGALLVGRIVNFPAASPVRRGQEKGFFQFGGSTVILILEKNRILPDEIFLTNSRAGEETAVKMGEKIGTAL